MPRRTIPRLLDYAVLSQRHRPADPAALAAEVRRMLATGLTPRDVATALRLQLDQVLTMVGRQS